MVRICVLGELVVECSGQPLGVAGSWRARSLLAWLALHPGDHPRGDVAARFWPDILDASARASLRTSLWALRRALGPHAGATLIATRDRVGLHGAPAVWLDATAFAEHLGAGRLDEALPLCRGELLAGLDDEWVHDLRDAHRARVGDLLERIAARAAAAGDPAAAIAWTRRRVTLDPLAEDAQRALIARLTESGDRAGALAAYSRLRERLRAELGLSASQETRELVARVREGDGPKVVAPPPRTSPSGAPDDDGWGPGAPFPLPGRLRRPAPAAFVGRGEELLALRTLWAQVRAGRGARLALVFGEAGIGKSRLVREVALEAQAHGAIVLHGTADEDLLVPHQHLVEALEHYVAVAAATELRRHVAPRAEDLEPIVPSLAGMAVPGPSASGRAESRRYRLFEAVAALLAGLSADAPVLLVLDDLQWADQSTAALLRHALESRPELRLLVLATQRSGEAAPSGAVGEALQRLTQGDLVERLALSGLGDVDVAALSRSLTGHELSAGLVRAIGAEAGGNPFFVQEVVRHLEASDARGGVLSLASAGVPDGVRAVVDLRVSRLQDACVRLLTVAAVLGAEFELGVLERVSDLEGEDLAAALDDALAAALVVEVDHPGEERFAFSHAIVRRALLARLSRAHRRRVHGRIAEALKRSRGDDALLEIAYHLCEALPAADADEALDYATRAAERAIGGLAYAEAVELFTRALSLLPRGDDRRRVLALKRALAYQALFHALMDTPAEAPRPAATVHDPAVLRA